MNKFKTDKHITKVDEKCDEGVVRWLSGEGASLGTKSDDLRSTPGTHNIINNRNNSHKFSSDFHMHNMAHM